MADTPITRHISEQRHILVTIKEHVLGLEQKNTSLSLRKRNLANWRLGLQKEFVIAHGDLKVIQSSVDHTVKEEEIIRLFQDLKQAIESLAGSMLRELGGDISQTTIGQALLHEPSTKSEMLKNFLDIAFQYYGREPFGYALGAALKHQLCASIVRIIFTPFSTTMPKEISDQICIIQYAAEKNETQDRVGRWRSMTYHQFRPNIQECEGLSKAVLEDILSLLNEFRGLNKPQALLMRLFGAQTRQVLELAMEFQYTAQTSWVDSNLEVSMFTDKSEWISVQSGRGNAKNAILAIGIGLFASKSVEVEHGGIEVQKYCYYKIPYICNNWHPVGS